MAVIYDSKKISTWDEYTVPGTTIAKYKYNITYKRIPLSKEQSLM
jgi:hypothetical protein